MTQAPRICRTVAEIITVLGDLDPATIPISHEPPFTGVKVVPQDNGKVYIASLWNTTEGREMRGKMMRKNPNPPVGNTGKDSHFPRESAT